MKMVELELTELEWEIINQALSAPIRDYLLGQIRAVGIEASEDKITKTWDEVKRKFYETW